MIGLSVHLGEAGSRVSVHSHNTRIRHPIERIEAIEEEEEVIDLSHSHVAAERTCLIRAGMSRRMRDDQSTRASLSGWTRGHHS
jgi:hypothetical protein